MAMTVKKFIALSCEAIECLSKNDARETYKSIKNNKNKLWLKFEDAEVALSLKVELNEAIEELEDELEDSPHNKDKLTKQLNSILSKSSTIRLIRDLEIGFHKKHGAFAEISKTSKINMKNSKKKTDKKKQLIASTTNETTQDEDSDDDEVFSFAAYMKLREKNLGTIDDEDDNDNDNDNHDTTATDIQNIKTAIENKNENIIPVDQNANYSIIAQHFKHDTTRNSGVDHSVLDFDDLQSIRLNEEEDDEYADSQMSLNQKNSNSNSNSNDTPVPNVQEHHDIDSGHRWSVDDDDMKRNDRESDESSQSSENVINNQKNKKKKPRKYDDVEEDENEESDDEFYDGESALNVTAAIASELIEPMLNEENKMNQNKKIKKKIKAKVEKNNTKKMKKKTRPPKLKIKSKKKMVNKNKKVKKNVINIAESAENESKMELSELKLVSNTNMEQTWNKLCERALDDNNWIEEDCEKIIDEAFLLNKKEIVIWSMWVVKCKQYYNKNKNKTNHIKFGVVIGYPSGQQCLAAKISEIKFCLKQKIEKIILYVSCGKIIDRDWKYIKKEVANVHKVIGKKCELQVTYAKSNQISNKTAAVFEQTVSQIIDK